MNSASSPLPLAASPLPSGASPLPLAPCRLMLATPCYHPEVCLNYLASVLWQTPIITGAGHAVRFVFTAGDAVNRQRNWLVHQFLKSDCTHLLFVDSDTSFRGADIVRMLAADLPVIGCNYPKREYNFPAAQGGTVAELIDSIAKGSVVTFEPPQPAVRGMIPVAYCGTGLLLIQRSVFERIAALDLVPQIRSNDGGTMHRFFSFEVINGDDLGEDYNFCGLCRKAGFQVYYDPAASATHMGDHEFRGHPQPAATAAYVPASKGA